VNLKKPVKTTGSSKNVKTINTVIQKKKKKKKVLKHLNIIIVLLYSIVFVF